MSHENLGFSGSDDSLAALGGVEGWEVIQAAEWETAWNAYHNDGESGGQ